MWPSTRWRVPVVLADDTADDAVACLAMVARYYRRDASIGDVRAALVAGLGRDPAKAEVQEGFTALAVANAASHFSLGVRGLKLDTAALLWRIRRPSILHMRSPYDLRPRPASDDLSGAGYFAVLSHVTEGQELHWIDPYAGPRHDRSHALFERCTGVVLEFSPAQALPQARLARSYRS